MGRFWVGWVVALVLVLGVACGSTKGSGDRGAGGEAASGGDGSGPGSTYVEQIRQEAVDKIDLLLVVDNSISMADKQALLADAMPLLVQRLITPRCVRPCTSADHCTPAQERDGIPVGGNADGTGRCAMAPGRPELSPIRDLHVGVITSSLGSHGASDAKDVCVQAGDDDHAHLLGELRGLSGTWNEAGFLAWDPQARKTPAGDRDPAMFVEKFTKMVRAAGELGCGYESTLEAWYRFLIDPEPPQSIVVTGGKSVAQGIDQTVLNQRSQFLRPDSVVAIVMLTDEDDCSIADQGYGHLVATSAMPLFRGTSECALNPNDHCCQSCAEPTANDGCPAISTDAECKKGTMLAQGADDLNLRCWEQKRRFGFDLLYPTVRYADALRSPLVPLRSGEMVQNPLFQAGEGRAPRDQGLVLLAGIVGVPWQDIADPESLTGTGLRYLTAAELDATGRWDVILGRPAESPPVPPTDPLMLATPGERTGVNPVTGFALVPATSTNPGANPINGHEQMNIGARDLQYACTFPLAKPRVCETGLAGGCDCFADDAVYNRSLCQPPGGGAAGTTQYYAKAYPGLRHLEVLRALKDNAIVASACPKIADDITRPDYGYNPAIDALVGQVKQALKPKCFPRPLAVAEDGSVPCTVIEAVSSGESCACDASLNRKPVSADLTAATLERMKDQGICGDASGVSCASICLCEVQQLSGDDLSRCQNDAIAPPIPGFCYVDSTPNEPNVGNPDLSADCSADAKRLIRFVGNTPRAGATAWIACEGALKGAR